MTNQQTGMPKQPGRGTTILILGILSLVCTSLLTGIPAWIMGKGDLAKIDQGLIAESERGNTKVGMILGIIGTIMGIIGIVFVIITMVIGFAAASGGNY